MNVEISGMKKYAIPSTIQIHAAHGNRLTVAHLDVRRCSGETYRSVILEQIHGEHPERYAWRLGDVRAATFPRQALPITSGTSC